MDIQARITPLIASLENTLGHCINCIKQRWRCGTGDECLKHGTASLV
jgi:hypothetical protein